MSSQPLTFDLKIASVGEGSYRISLDDAGPPLTANIDWPIADLELQNFVFRVSARTRRTRRLAGSPEEVAAKAFGARLFDALMPGEIGERYTARLGESTSARTPLRLRINLDDAPELRNVPWEFLWRKDLDFLCRSIYTPVLRHMQVTRQAPPVLPSRPLEVAVIISGANDQVVLDTEAEWASLQTALAELVADGGVSLNRVGPTLPELQAYVRQNRDRLHVLHFIGHGHFDEHLQSGAIVLQEPDGRSLSVPGTRLASLLEDSPPRLVVLNSCEGARTAQSDPFAGVAHALLARTVPAAIGMQFEITDEAAVTFASEFYRAIADGDSVEAAVSEARKAIYLSGNDIEWATPVLYMQTDGLTLVDREAETTDDIGRADDRDVSATDRVDQLQRGHAARQLEDAKQAISADDWALAKEILAPLIRDQPTPDVAALHEHVQNRLTAIDRYELAKRMLAHGAYREVLALLDEIAALEADLSDDDGLASKATLAIETEERGRRFDETRAAAEAAIDSEVWADAIAALDTISGEIGELSTGQRRTLDDLRSRAARELEAEAILDRIRQASQNAQWRHMLSLCEELTALGPDIADRAEEQAALARAQLETQEEEREYRQGLQEADRMTAAGLRREAMVVLQNLARDHPEDAALLARIEHLADADPGAESNDRTPTIVADEGPPEPPPLTGGGRPTERGIEPGDRATPSTVEPADRAALRPPTRGLLAAAGAVLLVAIVGTVVLTNTGRDDGTGGDGQETAVDDDDGQTTDDPADGGGEAISDGGDGASIAADSGSDSTDPVPGGTLTFGVSGSLLHLNGTVQAGFSTGVPGTQVNAGLVLLDHQYDPQPYLAESWEISADGLTVSMQLRDGAVFHDGAPITSEDVAFSILTSRDNHPFGTMFETVLSVDSSDPLTAVINLSEPHPAIFTAMTPGLLPIIPKHIFDDGQDMPTHPRNGGVDFVGSGPFRVVEYDPSELIRLERFDDFFLDDRPYLDEIVIDIVPDAVVFLEGLRNGDYDMATLPSTSVDEFSGDDRYVVEAKGHEAIGRIDWLNLNLRSEVLNDPGARQAIALAIDQQGWRDSVEIGHSQPNVTGIENNSPFYNAGATNFDHLDVETAKELMAEAGFPDGFELDMPTYNTQSLLTAELVKQNLAEIGVTVNIRQLPDFPTWAAEVAGGTYDITYTQVWNWGDPVIGVHRSYQCDNRIDPPGVIWSNNSWYCSTEVDALLDQARSTFDKDERRAAYFEATELINQDVPIIYLGTPNWYQARKLRVQDPPNGIWGFMSPWHEVWLSE